MNYLDIVLIIPALIGTWRGFKKGLVIELFTLLALLVGIYAGIHFSDWMASLLSSGLGLTTKYLPVIAFTIVFLGLGAMVYFAGKMIEKAVTAVALTPVNKLAGSVFGLIKMVYFTSTALVIIESYDTGGQFIPADSKSGSLLYEPVKAVSLGTIPALKNSLLTPQQNQVVSEISQ